MAVDGETRAQAEAARASRAIEGVAVLDLAGALERVGQDRGLLVEVAGLYLDDCPRLLTELAAALRTRDPGALQRAAHTLKGASATVGGTQVAALALHLEEMGRRGETTGALAVWGLLSSASGRLAEALKSLVGRPVE
ncbi:MAG: Hpt domain-containing protein [Planctomycetaceae bacterium]